MNRRIIGSLYEGLARSYLEAQGYRITECNYRCKSGEIDIIGMDGGYLCFIEVKYRKSAAFGTPLEAVDLRKQRRIISAAQYYLLSHPRLCCGMYRFDVVGIMPGEIRLVKNAFTL